LYTAYTVGSFSCIFCEYAKFTTVLYTVQGCFNCPLFNWMTKLELPTYTLCIF